MTARPMSDPTHPIWEFARFVIPIVALTIILWANASDFDVTEFQSIALMAGVLGGWQGVEKFLKKSS